MYMMIKRIKDPVSGWSHFAGVLFGILALVLLVYPSVVHGTPLHTLSFVIYGASLIILYTASTLYHMLPLGERGTLILRKLDHMAIYVLIAGTYTPICLLPLRGPWGWSLLGIIWGMAVAGIFLKAFWMNAPRWLSTLIYVIMGWMVVIAFFPLVRAVPPSGIAWLLAGGLLYSLGGLIYGTKWPRFRSRFFGFHELFHLFVLGGSLLHFCFMYLYVLKS